MSTRNRDAAMGLIGIAALIVYAIACRASFSPDGKKVLFPSVDAESKTAKVLLHDLESGKTSTIFTVGPEGVHDEAFISAQWRADGKRAILAWLNTEGSDRLTVLDMPIAGGGPSKRYTLEGSEMLEGLITEPPLIRDRFLLLGGKDIRRLDLETGEVRKRDAGEIYLFARGDDVYFVGKDGKIGKIDPDTLEPTALIEVDEKESGEPGFLAIDREGRIACTCKKGDDSSILVFKGKTIEKRIPLGKEVEAGMPGNIRWSPDGKTLYAAYGRMGKDGKDGKEVRLGILEIPLAGSSRTIEIVTGHTASEEKGPEPVFYFQFDLSPDGKKLAVPATSLSGVNDPDRGLYLVDLASPDRKVTKISIPAAVRTEAAPKPEKAGKD
jgi:DNA-binding beta-propeller fold protein YncE